MVEADLQALRQYQLKLLPLLQEFDSFCRQHNIQYFLVGGSALGAVRHQGFIPWDDDIDVGMPRSELNRLEVLLKTEKPEHWTFEPCDQHSYPHPPFPIISFQRAYNDKGELLPCIDVFPIDGVPESALAQRIQQYASYLYHLSILRQIPKNRGKWAARIVKLALTVMPSCGWIFCARVARKIVTHWSYENSQLVANIFGMAGYRKEIMPRHFLGVPQKAIFEQLLLPIPEQADAYLTHLYGNYMQPPPKEEQKPHHNDIQTAINS